MRKTNASEEERLRRDFERFADLPFPKLPDREDLDEASIDLLELDGFIAGKVLRSLNGNMSDWDLTELRRSYDDLTIICDRLKEATSSTSGESEVVLRLENYACLLRDLAEQALRMHGK
ncbi:hypothetical protein AB0J71_46445 [Nonomuraea sp. NPDC049637]|uniref:hypothetical protein n=1 Tax=Nonomuraea sp. NPDC049637 TaxID=3154356 RepID=UPI003422A1C1